MNKNDIIKIINSQKNFFNSGETKNYKFRINSLITLKKAIKNHEKEILGALYKDLKKPEIEAYLSEIFLLMSELKFTIKNLKKWTKPVKRKTPLFLFKGKSYIVNEPYGCSLIIAPWNYPFQLLLMPAIGAIAAGNTVILKPSEIAPATSKVVSKIINKYFPKKHIAVIEGGIKENQILLNEKFDYIFYTGNTNVGKIVMEAASKNLTPLTLELGGKSPVIIDKNTDLEIAAKRVIHGKFFNAGQTCIAPDYIFIHSDIKKDFVEKMITHIKNFYGEMPENSKDYARIINDKHFTRLSELLNDGNILWGGHTIRDENFIAPTIIEKPFLDSKLMQEEIFGPILPILEFKKINETIKYINSKPKPLALYLFTEDKNIKKKIIDETTSGGICINGTLEHITSEHLPFGGVGDSGMGSYHGKKTFETFSRQKSILDKSIKFDLKLKYPPYKIKLKTLKKLF